MSSQEAAPAATLILLRKSPSGYEIFMVERARTMGFAAGAMVFPGGKVDDSDAALALDTALARGFGGLDPVDAAARIAAVRETFEEAGVLVTRGPHVPDRIRRDWRTRLVGHDATFADFLRDTGHVVDADTLVPFAHWCPAPSLERQRFDTRFYLALMPANETALHDGEESTTSHWIGPAEALARADAGLNAIIFPTRRNLERLAAHDAIEALVAGARATPVRLVQPWVEQRGGVPHLCIPEGCGYPVTSEPLDTAVRG